MSIKFGKLTVGCYIWTTARRKMGNTAMGTTVTVGIRVVSIDTEKRTFVGEHHGDKRHYRERDLTKYTLEKPLLVYGFCDKARKATKEEKKLWLEGKLEANTNRPSPVKGSE
jgi:hypothetical protein